MQRLGEMAASIGMLAIGVGMLLPLLRMTDVHALYTYRWIFGSGALLFWAGRCVPQGQPGESTRLRRLRRMEFWSGACMGVATFMWFFNLHRFGSLPGVGSLMILRDPILFALAGAVLQLIAAWMIYFRQKREREQK